VQHSLTKGKLRFLVPLRASRAADAKKLGILDLLESGELSIEGGSVRSCIYLATNKSRVVMGAPSDDENLANMPADCRAAICANSTNTIRAAPLTLREWGRLLTIVLFEEQVRSKMLETALDLSRAQIDAGTSRDEVWVTDVARLFKDTGHIAPSIQDVESVLGYLQVNCQAGKMHKRDGASLKAYFDNTRVLFTNAKRRWWSLETWKHRQHLSSRI
jgi:hypothetical protein